jgi:hypothetical protein
LQHQGRFPTLKKRDKTGLSFLFQLLDNAL